jgi:hypothetical protein
MSKDKEWIGVDLDGTTAEYHEWMPWNQIGPPIMPMVERIRQWIAEGKKVKFFTARVRPDIHEVCECYMTKEKFTNLDMIEAVQAWAKEYVHPTYRFEVTCIKDVHMREFWDDRAVQVVPNTGRTLAEEHEAELTALRGKP